MQETLIKFETAKLAKKKGLILKFMQKIEHMINQVIY